MVIEILSQCPGGGFVPENHIRISGPEDPRRDSDGRRAGIDAPPVSSSTVPLAAIRAATRRCGWLQLLQRRGFPTADHRPAPRAAARTESPLPPSTGSRRREE